MLSKLKDFFTRHRRKFIVTGVVVGSTYVAIKYAQRKLIEYQEKQAREFVDKTRRIQHFESTERTCNQVIFGMSTELCQAIIRECSTDELLEQLRQNPPNKVELWGEIKVVAFTRLTTLLYATSMLVVALRVQLNLLGGYLYRDITSDQKRISDESKQQYLSLIRHFVHEGGLKELVNLIRSHVKTTMENLPLTSNMCLSDIEKLFWSIQMDINSDTADPNIKMSKYLLPAQVPEYNADGPLLQKMYSETLDLLETDDASVICTNMICSGFSIAVDAIAETIGENLTVSQKQEISIDTEETTSQNNNSILNIGNIKTPLAKIIPIVNGITAKGFDSTSRPQNLATSLVTFYVLAEKTKMFGANIYETFSST